MRSLSDGVHAEYFNAKSEQERTLRDVIKIRSIKYSNI